MPSVGQPAPDFTLTTDSGELLELSSLRGHWVVLYFYPRDNTPVCTTQSCAFRDAFPDFSARHALIFGISADTVASHQKFRRRFDLPFPLLADQDATVSKAYGVWKEKSLFGHKYMGIERTTFVIDPHGLIVRIFEKVKVRGHAAAVLATIEKSRTSSGLA
jgi:thioredoxin-dependent peroxiredoxin